MIGLVLVKHIYRLSDEGMKTSAIGAPSSACFKTNAICASVNFDAFMELSSSQRGIINGKFQYRLA
jgi:hypothetical protein